MYAFNNLRELFKLYKAITQYLGKDELNPENRPAKQNAISCPVYTVKKLMTNNLRLTGKLFMQTFLLISLQTYKSVIRFDHK